MLGGRASHCIKIGKADIKEITDLPADQRFEKIKSLKSEHGKTPDSVGNDFKIANYIRLHHGSFLDDLIKSNNPSDDMWLWEELANRISHDNTLTSDLVQELLGKIFDYFEDKDLCLLIDYQYNFMQAWRKWQNNPVKKLQWFDRLLDFAMEKAKIQTLASIIHQTIVALEP